MVVDEKTGIWQIALDIEKGNLVLQHATRLLLLVGRADVQERRDAVVVLERLVQAVRQQGYSGQVILTGPLPMPRDGEKMCNILQQARMEMKNYLRNVKGIHYTNAGEVLSDKWGVIPQLLDFNGLTLDGCRELQASLSNV